MHESDEASSPWQTWSPAERESFFAAIARHRRAAWRVTAACVLGYAVLTCVVSVLLSPLLWSVLGLLVDLGNVVVPLPDVLGWFGRSLDPLIDGEPVSGFEITRLLLVASLPGLLAMWLLSRALTRVLTTSPLLAGHALGGRAPNASVLAEQRLANVTAEMALAAGLPAPRVLIVPGGANAAAIGSDVSATILVGERLLETLDRDRMQGVLAHLIGSIGDGDLRIGRRTASTLALFSLIARFSSALGDPETFRRMLSMWRVFVRPTAENTATLLRALADPFDDRALEDPNAAPLQPVPSPASEHGDTSSTLTWRQWAAMPLAGPLIITGFIGGIVSQFLLGPLVALAWRDRKYMADATAVRLTRDPDALAGALASMARQPTGLPDWAMHLAVAGAGRPGRGGLFGGLAIEIFPTFERRGRALMKLGARTVPVQSRARLQGLRLALVAVLVPIVGGLMCVVVVLLLWLSVALSMLFTGLPVVLLHTVLRAIGH